MNARTSRKLKENLIGYAFVTPNFVAMLLFAGIPILLSMPLAFTQWNLFSGWDGIRFIGLENFRRMPGDIWFRVSMRNTLVYTLFTVSSLLVGGFFLANLINTGVYFKKLIRLLFFVPYISSIAAVAIIWRILLSRSGPIAGTLRTLGMTDVPAFLANPDTALGSLIVMQIWKWIGYAMIIFLAGLQTIPRDLYESADIDGAGRLRKMFSITLPMISPTTFFIMITLIINSFRSFAQVQIMTGGGPVRSTTVLVFYLYRVAFAQYEFGYASALAMVLFIIILVITLVQWQGQKRWVNY